jgi:hypothetical protein
MARRAPSATSANGDKSYSKERIEVFGGGNVAVLEDFRRLELVRGGKKRVFRSLLRQDKGHRGEWEAFVTAIQTGASSPIPFREVVSTMLATFALEESRCLGNRSPCPSQLRAAMNDPSRTMTLRRWRPRSSFLNNGLPELLFTVS